MNFVVQCKQLSERINALRSQVHTEEATKTAFILPFIQILGYDVFNPSEVIPEMDCDIARKKGDKIDYAIIKEGQPIMLIECKHCEESLTLHNSQLKRYYVASRARFGVLTNGIIYRFYTDLVLTNIMDDEPFLEIDFSKLLDAQIEELRMFRKDEFNIDKIVTSAYELKYLAELIAQFKSEFTSPSTEFVKLFAKRIYNGTVTPKVQDMFCDLIKRAHNIYINNIIYDKLDMPIDVSKEEEIDTDAETEDETDAPLTQEQMQAFNAVKSILCDVMPVERIGCLNNKSWLSVSADYDKRKNICRLFIKKTSLYMRIMWEGRVNQKYHLSCISDINIYADDIKKSASRYI